MGLSDKDYWYNCRFFMQMRAISGLKESYSWHSKCYLIHLGYKIVSIITVNFFRFDTPNCGL